MRTPDFWQQRGISAYALWPFSVLYGLGGLLHQRLVRPYTAPVPVLCIGNATAGGAGKTPVVRWLLSVLPESPQVVLRGYGGQRLPPTRVDPQQHTALAVGDEALMHAEQAITWVGADRAATIKAAVAAGAGFIVMDDGYQNPGIKPCQRWLVVDGATGFGNGFRLPAGPLRQSVASAIARADCVLVLGRPSSATAAALAKAPAVYEADIEIRAITPQPFESLLAFAGIAYPKRFFDALAAQGCTIVKSLAYADHHVYSPDERQSLRRLADQYGARLATTAKDAVRWPADERANLVIFDKQVRFSATDTASLMARLAL